MSPGEPVAVRRQLFIPLDKLCAVCARVLCAFHFSSHISHSLSLLMFRFLMRRSSRFEVPFNFFLFSSSYTREVCFYSFPCFSLCCRGAMFVIIIFDSQKSVSHIMGTRREENEPLYSVLPLLFLSAAIASNCGEVVLVSFVSFAQSGWYFCGSLRYRSTGRQESGGATFLREFPK